MRNAQHVSSRASLRPFLCQFAVALAISIVPLTTAWAQEEQAGQADLDKATLVKLSAKSMGDLETVVELCDAALEKGLDEEAKQYAEELLTATLFEQSSRLSRLIFERQPPDPRWPRIREACMEKLQRALQVRETLGNVHLLIARLQTLPGGDADLAKRSVERSIPLLEEDPDQLSEAYQVRAALSKSRDEAMENLNKSLELNPRNLEAWRARGVLYMSGGEFEKALEDLQGLLDRNPDDLLAHQAIAQALRQMKQLDAAKEHLNQVIQADPDAALAYNMRARIEEEQGQLDAAVEDLNQAIRIQPRDLGAVLSRGRLRAAQAQFDLARSDIDRALQLQPGLPQAIVLRSLISAGQGRFGEAIGDLQQVLRGQEEGSSEIKLQIATYLEMDRRPRRAIEVYTEVIAEEPENWMAMRRRGDAYLSVGQQADAIRDYEAALAIQPDETGLLNNLAWVLATSPTDELRDGKRALELAQRACQLTDHKLPHMLSTLAACYAELGDFAGAIEYSEKAVALDPEEPQLANELASYRDKKPWREIQETKENPQELKIPGGGTTDLPEFNRLKELLEPEDAPKDEEPDRLD